MDLELISKVIIVALHLLLLFVGLIMIVRRNKDGLGFLLIALSGPTLVGLAWLSIKINTLTVFCIIIILGCLVSYLGDYLERRWQTKRENLR